MENLSIYNSRNSKGWLNFLKSMVIYIKIYNSRNSKGWLNKLEEDAETEIYNSRNSKGWLNPNFV